MTVLSNPAARFGSVSMVTASLGVNDPEIGTKTMYGGDEYIFIYNAGGSQISVGNGCFPAGNAGATSGGYSMTVTATTGVGMMFGVCKHATLTTATYGWVVARGFVPIAAATGVTIAPGDAIIPGANGTFTNVVPTFSANAATTPIGKTVGQCISTAATGLNGVAYFRG